MIYRHDFTLEHCYNILKDHQGWLEIEMPAFYESTKGRKKSKTSETTSGSASGDFNLNDEADDRQIIKHEKGKMEKDGGATTVQLKNQGLDIREAERREAAKLKRDKLAIQRRTLELAEREKRDRDILFYNSEINSSLPAIQRKKLQEIKDEISEQYNLDY
nr:hypothetical protein [Tanacetum cinerariifolium]